MTLPHGQACLWLLALVGCSTMEWQPCPAPDTWRGASVWSTEYAVVAATSEDAASETATVYAELHATFLRLGLAPPPRPLILVVDEPDEPLLGDSQRTLEQLAAWQHEALAVAGEPGAVQSSPRPQPPPPEATPEMLRAMAKALAAGVPPVAPELALPPSWQRLATWGLVMPTEGCAAAAADVMLEVGLEQADLGFGKRLLMAPFMPLLRSKMRGALREAAMRLVVDASWARAAVGSALPAAKKKALLEAMGVTTFERDEDSDLDPVPDPAAKQDLAPPRTIAPPPRR